jgi:hypothetical protein
MRSRLLLMLTALAGLSFFGFCLWALSLAMNVNVALVQTQGVPPATTGDTPLAQAWSVPLSPSLVHEMALASPGKGEFFALNSDEILRFNSNGVRVAKFAAPAKSSRIVTDPVGAVPYLMVVSRSTKWTGAIDHVVTTDHFLHALDGSGREAWRKRFDPKDTSVLEPVISRFEQRPVIVLSASKRIICFDANGNELWNIPLWHHPFTVTEAHSSVNSGAVLLAALAPKREIVSVGADGKVLGAWGTGDGPSRFRTMKTARGLYGVSLRQVFGRGQGVRHALAFFDSAGKVVREVELPPDALLPTYSPIAAMDIDGSGARNWALVLGDGTILVYSPTGQELARQSTGSRTHTFLPVPQQAGPDLLITATNRGLMAWKPVPGRMRPSG